MHLSEPQLQLVPCAWAGAGWLAVSMGVHRAVTEAVACAFLMNL